MPSCHQDYYGFAHIRIADTRVLLRKLAPDPTLPSRKDGLRTGMADMSDVRDTCT